MIIPPEKKIRLTKEGDILVMPRDRKDEYTLPLAPDAIGWHEKDDGYIGLEQGTDTTHELVCWGCRRLRIPIPNTITTYRELRAFFEKTLEAPP